MSKNVSVSYDGRWEFFRRPERPKYEITGKYLFFSSHRNLLVQIAGEELESGRFHEAKIPIEGQNVTPGYVLCLYYKDDSREHELAEKYRGRKDINYQGWKSDEATRKGEYSEQFVRAVRQSPKKLPPEIHRLVDVGIEETEILTQPLDPATSVDCKKWQSVRFSFEDDTNNCVVVCYVRGVFLGKPIPPVIERALQEQLKPLAYEDYYRFKFVQGNSGSDMPLTDGQSSHDAKKHSMFLTKRD